MRTSFFVWEVSRCTALCTCPVTVFLHGSGDQHCPVGSCSLGKNSALDELCKWFFVTVMPDRATLAQKNSAAQPLQLSTFVQISSIVTTAKLTTDTAVFSCCRTNLASSILIAFLTVFLNPVSPENIIKAAHFSLIAISVSCSH